MALSAPALPKVHIPLVHSPADHNPQINSFDLLSGCVAATGKEKCSLF